MKNFKKLFAIIATMAIVGSTVPTAVLGAAGYSDELEGAYDYAYENGVTTQSSIDTANMYGSLIRSHMAKMMANYAIEVLGQTPDTDATCEFTDIANETEELQEAMVTACQLGLMGQGITAFNPNGVVTRAQFGTVLSRALWGDTYNDGDPYYADHLQALKDAGIMNNISNPNAVEVRGYVMLMLQRADEGVTSEICETEENVLACSLGLDTCPAECEEEEVAKAGTLAVSMESSKGGDVPYSVPALEVATYTLEAGDEDISLESLTLEQGGFSSNDTLDKLALVIDGQRVSKFVNIDDETTVNLTTAYEIKAGSSVEVAVVVAIPDNTPAIDGDKFDITLTAVESSAKDVDMDDDLTSATYTILNKPNAIIEVVSTTAEDVNLGEEGVELFDIKLDNTSDQNALVKSITFKGTDADYEDYFKNFELQVDGETIAEVENMDGKYLTFNIEDGFTIEDTNNETFTIIGDVIGGSSETSIAFFVEKSSDIVAEGAKYSVPVAINDAADNLTLDDNYAVDTFKVKAGDISLTKTNPGSDAIVRNRDNLSLGAFTIKNNAGGDLTLQNFKLTFTYTAGNPSTGTDMRDVLDSVKIRVGSTSASLKELDAATNNSVWTYTDLGKEIGSNLTIYVYADTVNRVLDGDSFKMVLSDLKIEDADEEVVAAGDISPATLSFSTMNGGGSELTVTKTTLTPKSVAKGSEDLEAVTFKVKTSTTEGADITKLTFTSSDATVNTNTINSASVFVGDTEYPATIKSNGTIVAEKDFTLKANTTTTVTLKISLQDEPTKTSFTYSLTEIEANDTSSDENDLTSAYTLAGRPFTVVAGATLVVDYEATATSNKYAKSILAGTTATVAEYSVYANYEAVTVGAAAIEFDTDALDTSVTDVELYYEGELVASNPTWTDTTNNDNFIKATFDDLNFDITTAEGKLVVKVITTTINSDGGDTKEEINITKLTLSDLEGATSGDEVDNDSGTPLVQDFVANTETQKDFDIVPVTVVTSITDVTATTAKLNLTVNKGNNTDASASNLAAKATIEDLALSIAGNNGGLVQVYVKNDSNVTIRDWTDADAGKDMDAGEITALTDQILSAGTTTWTVYVVHAAGVDNPSYTLSIDGVTYKSNIAGDPSVSDRAGVTKTIISK